jgi:4-hydroxybenzoate polyprenyltransferase
VKHAGLTLSMATLQACSGVAIDAGPMFYLGMLAGSSHVLWQVHSVNLENPADCLSKFKSNGLMGALPMTGIVLNRLLAST